jgi:hypothetical protein
MANTRKVDQVWTADIAKVNQVAIANIASLNGVTWVSTAENPFNGVLTNSMVFESNASEYLRRLNVTANPAAGERDQFTFSCWFKIAKPASISYLWTTLGDANNYARIYFTGDTINYATVVAGASTHRVQSTRKLLDSSGWYHLVINYDSSEAAQADRCKFWINGVEESVTQVAAIGLNEDSLMGYGAGVYDQYVGSWNGATGTFDGLITGIDFVDRAVVAYTEFGEFSNGIWVPKSYTNAGNYNSVQLWMATGSNMGDDTSGSTDGDFTVMNATEAANHSADCPEDNHCVLDQNISRSNITDLDKAGTQPEDAGAAWHTACGTFLLQEGKWYFEVDIGSDTDDIQIGFADMDSLGGDIITSDMEVGDYALGVSMQANGSKPAYVLKNNAVGTDDDNLANPAADDVMQACYDAATGKVWFGVNNTWGDFGATGVGDPANGTNPAFTFSDPDNLSIVPIVAVNAHSTGRANFGDRTFAHTPPTGFKAMKASNISTPENTVPEETCVNIVEYEGDGTASQGITGVGFQPDLVWIKNRDAADEHCIFDSVRGATKFISSDLDSTTSESTDADTLLSFDSDGFSVGADVKVNTLNETYQALCLREGSAYGFDIVSYSGTGVAKAENHSLSAVPKLILIKNLDQADSWAVYHFGGLNKSDPETDYGELDLTTAWTDDSLKFNDTAPTSSQFTVGTDHMVNASGEAYIAYLFADVPGTMRIFTYEGNGNADGPYVHCGFRPSNVIIKNVDASAAWMWYSKVQQDYNQSTRPNLNLDTASAASPHATTEIIDLYANGFKVRTTAARQNTSNQTYVGIAFAEHIFNWGLAN